MHSSFIQPFECLSLHIVEKFKDEFPNEKNPALEKMKEVITKQFEAKSDSRALIFVKEREYVTAILEWFHEELPEHAVDFVVGAQASAEKGGKEIFLEKGTGRWRRSSEATGCS